MQYNPQHRSVAAATQTCPSRSTHSDDVRIWRVQAVLAEGPSADSRHRHHDSKQQPESHRRLHIARQRLQLATLEVRKYTDTAARTGWQSAFISACCAAAVPLGYQCVTLKQVELVLYNGRIPQSAGWQHRSAILLMYYLQGRPLLNDDDVVCYNIADDTFVYEVL